MYCMTGQETARGGIGYLLVFKVSTSNEYVEGGGPQISCCSYISPCLVMGALSRLFSAVAVVIHAGDDKNKVSG